MAEGTGLDRIHYGVVDVTFTEGTNGLGTYGQPGTLQAGAALGWDRGDYTGPLGYYNYAEILAHEVGHLMGRRHVPAGNAGSVDRACPYSQGSIGTFGFDLERQALLDPAATFDLMGYQSPRWISNWTYQGILAFRAAAPPPDASPAQDCLLISGDVTGFSFDGLARLEPAFQLPTRPLAPVPSYFTLECLDAAGAVLLAVPFGGRPAALENRDRFPFLFTVPFPPALATALRTLRVTRGTEVVWEQTVPAPGPTPGPVARRTVPGVVRLTWDRGVHPGVMVWDPRTHEVLGLGRTGSLDLATDAPELDLMLSDGVRSQNRRLRVLDPGAGSRPGGQAP